MSKDKIIETRKVISKKDHSSNIENEDDSENTILFKRLLKLYLENKNNFDKNSIPEFEVRFGTKKIKSISKIDFNNVIKMLMFKNFKLNSENYSLKIILDNEDSELRTEIFGLPNVELYCKHNNIDNIENMQNIQNVNFVEKKYYQKDNNFYYPIDFDDYNFRISFQVENYYNYNTKKVQDVLNKWNSIKKIFRYVKRYEFRHPDLPLNIHLSIVKMSKMYNNKLVPHFNIKDSDVFNSPENYEIEIEVINPSVGYNSKFETGYYLFKILKKTIQIILMGLQESNYPISLLEQNNVLNNYLLITKGQSFEKYDQNKKINVKDFIGPSSIALQLINMIPEININDTNKSIPNIRNNYCVTDKADGLRKLLFIDNIGKIYLISMSMSIQFTGTITENKEIFNTIIDGEHILNDKNGKFINLYACFDIYYINSKNVTGLAFINNKKEEIEISKISKKQKEEISNYRLNILNSVIKEISLKPFLKNTTLKFEIIIKKFYSTNIFKASQNILNSIKNGLYQYDTDGLIYTPMNTGVSSSTTGISAPNYKVTWNECFKWKPPEFNTIDFLVKFKKNEYGQIQIKNIYNEGINMTSSNNLDQYITLILQVGFDEKNHGYINPLNDIINDNIKTKKNNENYKTEYKPMQFYPTNPSDENAGICNLLGKTDKSGILKVYTLENEEIEDNTIVEFKYDNSKSSMWKWIPLRVRNDKTSELKSGIKNFGNAYHVANATWHSIHNPVKEEFITSGQGFEIDNNDDDVYYNKINNKTETRALRDFHNLYIKNLILKKTIKSGNTLIDYACGKGGDLPKWINSNLNFVLGIDLSKDNIENRLDGACARYLNYCQKYTSVPSALFLNGNSSVNIKNGDAFNNEKSKNIVKALFGEGTKNEVNLGKGVYKNYGIASNGFNISSIQFAIHYMFENEQILNEFLKNVSQCTAINGYFIGSCFDGKKIFKMMESYKINEFRSLFKDDKKIWQIYKKYSNVEYNDDESCLGYAIDIYQESINKNIREYLVNFDYLTRILENYGFVKLTKEEVKELDLPDSICGFEEMYNFMLYNLERNKSLINSIGSSLNMSDQEKEISFLNNYFIYKKVRNIDNIPSLVESKQDLDKIQNENLEKEKELINKDYESLLNKENEDKIKQAVDSELNKSEKIKLTIDEKISLAEKKKKQKEEEKAKLKEEKAKLKEEKAKLKEEKKLNKSKK